MKTNTRTIIVIVVVVLAGIAFQATLLIGNQQDLKKGREELGGFCKEIEIGKSVEGLSSRAKQHGFRERTREDLTKCDWSLANCKEGDVLSQTIFNKVYGYFKARNGDGFQCMMFYNSETEKVTEVRYIELGDDVFRNTLVPPKLQKTDYHQN